MSTDPYEDLSAQISAGEYTVIPGTTQYGKDAANTGAEAIMNATGTTNINDATNIALGRPRAGTNRGPSPTIRARVPHALKTRIEALAVHENRPESEIVRDAVIDYLDAHASS